MTFPPRREVPDVKDLSGAMTVGDINRAFRERGLGIELPYPAEWIVVDVQILEKKDTAREVKVLLAVELLREGRLFKDLCFLEGEVVRPKRNDISEGYDSTAGKQRLPIRDRTDFRDESEAVAYLREAFGSLLKEYGYRTEEHEESDLYATLDSRGFFVCFAAKCDSSAADKAEHLIDLRKKYKHLNDYALVVPAFQESLGVPLSEQEAWIMGRVDRLSMHRVGVYGVDNSDPNRIYPFTVYPQVRGLLRYFVATSRQWQDVRSQYVLSRGRGAGRMSAG